jgi:hypothetical protein
MSSKSQSYILALIMTIVAGIGMLSTGMAAFATTNDVPPTQSPQPQPTQYQYVLNNNNNNENDNDNENVNANNIQIGSSQPQYVAQIPSYQYQPPYSPPAYTPPAPPIYTPPVYYEAPGIPNTGIGDIGAINLALLIISGLFFAAGIAYLFPWSKQDVKYS